MSLNFKKVLYLFVILSIALCYFCVPVKVHAEIGSSDSENFGAFTTLPSDDDNSIVGYSGINQSNEKFDTLRETSDKLNSKYFKLIKNVCYAISIIFFIIATIRFISSSSNPQAKKEAQKSLIITLTGFFLFGMIALFMSFASSSFIG